MKLHDHLKTLQLMSNRVMALNSRVRPDPQLEQWFKDILDADKQMPAEEKEAILTEARRDPNGPKARAVMEARVTEINNYLRANSNYAGLLFNTVTLGETDWAEFENTTNYEVKIGYVAEDGKRRLQKAVSPRSREMVPLQILSSDWFGYKLRDLYKGSVAGAAQATVDIAFDLQFKLDRVAHDLFKAAPGSGGALGTFTPTTGAKNQRIWHLHSGIDSTNLPTTNVLVCATASASKVANTTSTPFRLDVMREVVHYCSQWGNIWSDGPLAPTGIIMVPSKDAAQIGTDIDPYTVESNRVTDNILSQYMQIDYLGYRWTIVPDVTIPPNVCYPILNKPIGEIFFKPSMDTMPVRTDEMKNWEERAATKVYGMYIPAHWRMRACSVRYRTDA